MLLNMSTWACWGWLTIAKCDLEDKRVFLCEIKEEAASVFLLSRLKGRKRYCLGTRAGRRGSPEFLRPLAQVSSDVVGRSSIPRKWEPWGEVGIWLHSPIPFQNESRQVLPSRTILEGSGDGSYSSIQRWGLIKWLPGFAVLPPYLLSNIVSFLNSFVSLFFLFCPALTLLSFCFNFSFEFFPLSSIITSLLNVGFHQIINIH